MKEFRCARFVALVVSFVGVVVVGLVAISGPAVAATVEPSGHSTAQLREKCGYLGWGEYRHCDGGTGSTVDLDVEDVWGNRYRYCVGPGVTDVQPVIRWRVTGAWWNGGVRCYPGFEGPA
jgi:hypothetical protein